MGTKTIVIGVGLVVAAIMAFFLFSSSEEDRIKVPFKRIAETISKKPDENQISAMAKIRRLKDVFAPRCRVDAPVYGLDQEMAFDEIAAFMFRERSQYRQITLKFHRFTIKFPNENQAVVNVTVGFAGESTAGVMTEDYHVLMCNLIKPNDTWQLKQINVVEVLETSGN